MKNYRTLEAVTLTVFAVGYLMIPTVVKADNPDSADITKLLTDTRVVATQLKVDSGKMDSFTRSKLSWQSYAAKLDTIKGHINNAGQRLAKLKDAESTGSPWQQTTIKRTEPLLQELADNLTATINHLSENQNKVHFPPFTDYVKANYAMSIDLEEMLRASIDYGTDKAKFNSSPRDSSRPPYLTSLNLLWRAPLSPRQRHQPARANNSDFSEHILDIAFAEFPIRREPSDRERGEIIVEVCGAALVAQVIGQNAHSPISFARRQAEKAQRLTGPLHDHFPSFAGPIAFVRDSR
jgi:hypothetical protein